MLKKLIFETVRSVLKELTEPEAPEGSSFGKYLFAPDRENVPDEPNTETEDEFQWALQRHYEEYSGELTKMWPALWDMKQKNQYKKFLDPPSKPVYRFLSRVYPEAAAEMLGIPVEEIFNTPNKILYAGGGGTTKSKREIQSWTIDPTLPSMNEFVTISSSRVTMLLVADPQTSGRFLINPVNLAKEMGENVSEYVADELEVVSYGPVKITGAAFYYSKNYLPLFSKEEIKQLLKKYDILNAYKEYVIPKEILTNIVEEVEEAARKRGAHNSEDSSEDFFTYPDGDKILSKFTRLSLEEALAEIRIYVKPKKIPDLKEKLLATLNL